MKLKHHFQLARPAKTLSDSVLTIDEYMDRVRADAKTLRVDENIACDAEMRSIGDGFELFGEFFVRHFGPTDNRLFIKDYELLEISDNGIDARGRDARTGYPVFIQYKGYREYLFIDGVLKQNILTGEQLNTFVAETYMVLRDEGASKEEYDNARMVVITTANDIARYTKEEKFRNRVECYPAQVLRDLTHSPEFWKLFHKSVRSV